MLEEISVSVGSQTWEERRRGTLSAQVAAEFPSIFVSFADEVPSAPHLSASEWDRSDFDDWTFDERVDALAGEPFTLRVVDDRSGRWPVAGSQKDSLSSGHWPPDTGHSFPLEVLNRCQRAIGRRNQHSQGHLFDRVLHAHRSLHDLSKPLVRADYNHAIDTWQWLLRLDGSASVAAQLAALFHDVERLVTEADERIEQLAPDYQEFKDAHARRGAEMTDHILAGCNVPQAIRERVSQIITAHERQSGDAEVSALNDADALSWFSLNSPGYAGYFGPEQTRKKLAYTWNRMREGARAKLASVRLRADVRAMLEERK